jgi:uncharacterized membrane protein
MMSWNGDGMWGRPPAGGVGGWLVILGLLLLGTAVVLLVSYLMRARAARQRTEPSGLRPDETASDILRRRYASGLIQRDDYLQRLDDLR